MKVILEFVLAVTHRWLGRASGQSCLAFAMLAASCAFGQAQFHYTGSIFTGQVVLTTTVNLSNQTQSLAQVRLESRAAMHLDLAMPSAVSSQQTEYKYLPKLLPPPPTYQSLAALPLAVPVQSLPVTASSSFGFQGLTHYDQRNANNGNQFSTEPPSQGLGVSDRYIVEGVNNAILVYSLTGTPLLPKVLATNQVFGVAPAINRTTGFNGVFPTDIRVFYDRDTDRWYIVQRVQANDAAGNELPQSSVYIAVSQTGDPTQGYNVYVVDSTQIGRPGCPCLADYPELGADANGFYVTWTDYQLFSDGSNSQYPLGASILAISKTALASGVSAPNAFKFVLPSQTLFEFAIAPASVPPGASNFVANGGLEYFFSSNANGDSNLSLWAMTNTSSLATPTPNLSLTRTLVPTLSYGPPNDAVQRNGPIPYGASLTPPGRLELLDGSDSRVLNLVYSGGRLFLALGTTVTDVNGYRLAGVAYFIISPTYRANLLAANVLKQGFILTNGENLLRPAVSVNSQGRGAIVLTLVGPDYYPSAAFVPIDLTGPGPAIQIAAPGAFPEDGFSGYAPYGAGTARWGDYSAAVTASDGSIWMATEFIPNTPRTTLANWGTYVVQYRP